MKTRSIPWLCFLAGIAAILHIGVLRAEIMVADSIEWRVAGADAIVRASVDSVATENGPDGLVIEKASLKINDVLKGKSPAELIHAVRLYTTGGWEKFDRPSRWKKEAVQLLVFMKGGSIASVLRLDGKKAHGQGYRAFTMDMKAQSSKNSILAAVYSALAFEEKVKPEKSIRIDVPSGTEIYPEVWGGSAVYLVVPLDSRLERTAQEWAKSSDPWLKPHGERVLEQIKKKSRGP